VAELTLASLGIPIKIDVNHIFRVRPNGRHTIIKARLDGILTEFEVLEAYDKVMSVNGILKSSIDYSTVEYGSETASKIPRTA
jgi:hypothetical protein